MIKIEVVLFDWNNTIVNDFGVWWNAIRETFRVFGKKEPTIREYFEGLTGDYLDFYKQRGINASREELNKIYEASYERRINEIILFPGVKEFFDFLNRRLIAVGLVTQQKDFLISPLLKKFGLNEYLSYYECHALDKKETICQILRHEKIEPKKCCFVGDAPSDINHGKKAGVITIAFLTKNIPEDLIVAVKPDFTIKNLEEIRAIVKRSS